MARNRGVLTSDLSFLPANYGNVVSRPQGPVPQEVAEGRVMVVHNGNSDDDILPSIEVVVAEQALKLFDGPDNTNAPSNWPAYDNDTNVYPYRDFSGNDQVIGDSGISDLVVTAYPSLQAMEWLATPLPSGIYDRTEGGGNDIWRVITSEIYKPQDTIRVYRIDTNWFFDCAPEPTLLVRVDSKDDAEGNFTGTVLECQNGGPDDYKENGSISIFEVNKNAFIKIGSIVEVTMERWKKRPYFSCPRPNIFLALVGNNTLISANHWSYSLQECDCTGTVIFGGRVDLAALNLMERPNNAFPSMMGNGVDTSLFPAGFTGGLTPVVLGTVVIAYECADGTLVMSSPNGISGSCS